MTSDTDTRFDDLYRAHARAVHAYCLRRTRREEAKDATSDVFLVAWRRIDDVPAEDHQLLWLLGIARNVLANRDRSERRRFRLTAKAARHHDPSVPGPELQLVENERHRELIEAIAKLPQRDREILRLVEWDGLSRGQVADMYAVGRAAVDKRITRAYKKLARLLDHSTAVDTTPSNVEEGGGL